MPKRPQDDRLLPKQMRETREGLQKMIEEVRKAPSEVKEDTVIPPSSPKVQQAVDRLLAWLPINERNGPNPGIRRDVMILKRGGPMAEKLADHILTIWQQPPWLKSTAPTIEHQPPPEGQ